MYKNSWLFILAVVLILAIVFIPTVSFDFMLEDDTNKFSAKIQQIIETDTEDSTLYEKCNELQKLWDKHMQHWSFVVHHNAIEKIDLGIAAFIEHTKAGDRKSALVEAERLYRLFEITSKQDELSMINIL